MAIATLAEVYNNPDVFRRVVKIRKGLSCQMMVETNNMVGVHHAFRTFADDIAKRVPPTDPSAKLTTSLVEKTRQLTPEAIPKSLLRFSTVLACFTLIVVTMYLFSRYRDRHSQLGSHAGQTISIADFTAVLALFASVGYLFGFMGMQYV
jgi:farnesyl-diphosphate farnesyltransferase